MSIKNQSEELFMELQQEYKSPYFPTKEEKKEALMQLYRALFKQVDPEVMKRKIRILATLHGDHKTKISTLIINQFWNQDLDFGVKARKFKDEQ